MHVIFSAEEIPPIFKISSGPSLIIFCSKTRFESSNGLSTWQEISLSPASLVLREQSAVIPSGKVRGILKLNSLSISFDSDPLIMKIPFLSQEAFSIDSEINVAGIFFCDLFSSIE